MAFLCPTCESQPSQLNAWVPDLFRLLGVAIQGRLEPGQPLPPSAFLAYRTKIFVQKQRRLDTR